MAAINPSSINAVTAYLFEMVGVLGRMQEASIDANISLIYRAWAQRKQIFIIGNGGSAATASHMANDLSKGAIVPGKARVKAIALTDNVALISAWANDTCYENVFKEQLENLMDRMDLVLGISASGNSPNILRAMEYARQKGAVTVGWTGASGGKLKDMVDLAVLAPTDDVGMIESCHMVLDHLVTVELRRRIHEKSTEKSVGRKPTIEKTPFLSQDTLMRHALVHHMASVSDTMKEIDEAPARGNGNGKTRRYKAATNGRP